MISSLRLGYRHGEMMCSLGSENLAGSGNSDHLFSETLAT